MVGDTLTCSYDFQDPDLNTDSSSIQWYYDGNVIGTGSTLSSGFSFPGPVTCEVLPYDGIDYGAPVQLDQPVKSSPPTLTGVTLTSDSTVSGDSDPTTAMVGDLISCQFTYTDADTAQVPNADYKWYFDGVEQPSLQGSESLSTEYSAGLVTCSVTLDDPPYTVTDTSAPLTVLNSLPTVSAPTIETDNAAGPTVLQVNDELYCFYSFSDPDVTQIDQSILTWYLNGVAQPSDASDPGLYIGAQTSVDSVVRCEVQAFDGVDYGNTASTEITASNTAPYLVTSLRSDDRAHADGNPYTGTAGDSLYCIVNYFDDDLPDRPFVQSVHLGYQSGCLMGDNGRLNCWGKNDSGQTDAPKLSFDRIDGGDGFWCGVTDTTNEVACWGAAPLGAPTGTGFTEIASGANFACAVDAANALTCWGDDPKGRSVRLLAQARSMSGPARTSRVRSTPTTN